MIAGLAMLLGVGCALESADLLGDSQKPVIGGTPYGGHPAVMEVMIDGPGYYGTCTGTLIAPSVVLTAAHCMEDYAGGQESARVSNVQTPNRNTPGHWTKVSSVEVHPVWPSQQFINLGHDCAILGLATAVPNVTPMPVYRGGNPAVDLKVGNAVTIMGYGNNVGSPGSGSGTKRYTTDQIRSVHDGVVAAGRSGATSCQGDSGGGLLSVIGGVEQIIGITSYGLSGCISSGSFTNVSKTCLDLVRKYVPDQPGTCQPSCSARECGDDGCGGTCGICAAGLMCSASGTCEDSVPPPVSACDEAEPNNGESTANSLCTDGRFAGTVSGLDSDYVAFSVAPGRTYSVRLVGGPSNANFTLYKKNPGSSSYSKLGSGPAPLQITTSLGGSYVVKVHATSVSATNYVAEIVR